MIWPKSISLEKKEEKSWQNFLMGFNNPNQLLMRTIKWNNSSGQYTDLAKDFYLNASEVTSLMMGHTRFCTSFLTFLISRDGCWVVFILWKDISLLLNCKHSGRVHVYIIYILHCETGKIRFLGRKWKCVQKVFWLNILRLLRKSEHPISKLTAWIGLFNSKYFDYPTFCTLVGNENRILSDSIASLFTLMDT